MASDAASERVSALEEIVINMQAREAEMHDKLQQILNALSQSTPISPITSPSATPVPDVRPKVQTVRPASPPEFDGDRTKGVAFLNSCQTYIRLCPREFPDEQIKIVWAMSYMKSGRAQRWTARIFRWDDFSDKFKTEFTPAHVDSVAINQLESSAYY